MSGAAGAVRAGAAASVPAGGTLPGPALWRVASANFSRLLSGPGLAPPGAASPAGQRGGPAAHLAALGWAVLPGEPTRAFRPWSEQSPGSAAPAVPGGCCPRLPSPFRGTPERQRPRSPGCCSPLGGPLGLGLRWWWVWAFCGIFFVLFLVWVVFFPLFSCSSLKLLIIVYISSQSVAGE